MSGKRIAPFVILVKSGVASSQSDLRTHLWYDSGHNQVRRLCDDFASGGRIRESHKQQLIPCRHCEDLYVHDMAFGRQALEYFSHFNTNEATANAENVLYSLILGVHPTDSEVYGMVNERPTIGMATFARFYDAPASAKVRIVRDTLTNWANPEGYKQRDYYWAFRNTLKRTHWTTNDPFDFDFAVGGMVEGLNRDHQRQHYEVLSQAYLDFWGSQPDAQFFSVLPTRLEIAGLVILVNPEVGLRRHGDTLALKLWLNAPRPKKQFRQALQYLMEEAQERGWDRELQPALWDVRRGEIMPRPSVARDFSWNIRGQAAAFREMWDSLGPREP